MKFKNVNIVLACSLTGLRIADYIITAIALPLGAVELNPLKFGLFHQFLLFFSIAIFWFIALIAYKSRDRTVNIAIFITFLNIGLFMIFILINNSINLITLF